ncbi:MAG: radical SAM protein [Desulfobacterales bacterium]|nr:radical SAM protein [Desulfobacterales bacterium]
MLILIHPPVVKPSEPPPGIAKLAGALIHHNIPYGILDANLEGILSLLKLPVPTNDTWTKRASRHLPRTLRALTQWQAYENIGRYRSAVMDINRILQIAGRPLGMKVSLANYQHRNLSPIRSLDLLKAFENPHSNLFYPYFEKRLTRLFEKEKPSLVGFSLNFLSQALCTFAMIGFIRQISPGLKIILGGGLITSWIKSPVWNNPFKGIVDELVCGPGEKPLLSRYGISMPKNHYTPSYKGFSRYNYLSPGFILPYSASTGCYWNKCSFCPERAEKNIYRPAPVQQVQKDLQSLINKNRPALVHFTDNAVSPKLLTTLADAPLGISQLGIPWYGFARISPLLADLDFCLALKRSGCVMLKLGLESGDQRVLEHMQKGFDLQLASQNLKILKKAKIATYIYLLFGTPSETLTEAQHTLDFTAQHSHTIDFLNLAIFNLPAYGPDSQKLDTRKFYEGDLSLYKNFIHPKGWDRYAIRQFLDKKFKRNPAVASILRKDPPVFTSNHAPFFLMIRNIDQNQDRKI